MINKFSSWLLFPLLFVLGVGLTLSGYLLVTLVSSNGKTLQQLEWSGEKMAITSGIGSIVQGNLVLRTSGEQTAAALLPLKAVMAEDYPQLVLELAGMSRGQEILLLWQSRESRDQVIAKPLLWNGEESMVVYMEGEPSWRGGLTKLGVGTRGQGDESLRIHKLILKPAATPRPLTAAMVLSPVFSNWLAHVPWSGGSINFNDVAADADFPLILAAVVAASMALLLYFLLSKLGGPKITPFVLGGFMLLAWVAVDAAWQFNLWRSLGGTLHQYWGKSHQEKLSDGPDGELFAFIREVKAHLPQAPARVLYFSGEPYQIGRGAYHLYPHNVFTYGYQDTTSIPAPEQFRKGDFVVLYQRSNLRYDREKGLLIWGGQSRAAEMIFSQGNNLLLKVL